MTESFRVGAAIEPVLDKLAVSPEPSIRYKLRAGVLGENPDSASIRSLRQEIRTSERVGALLAGRQSDGRLLRGQGVYAKWQGAHWVMATLADLGYPPGDSGLVAIRDQLLEEWLAAGYFAEYECASKAKSYGGNGVPVMEGRYRRCGSQQGNALYAIVSLGLADERTEALAERLLHWQWPDGGWNCDRNPGADTSSFMETLTPLRGLVALNQLKPDSGLQSAIDDAAGVFLEREMCRRRSDGTIIHPEFLALHYPLYWHYDILGGLKVMAEAGKINDPRCAYALDLLEDKRLADGGFPAEKRYYKTGRVAEAVAGSAVGATVELGADSVNWGGTSKRVSNPWVTVDALTVLAASGRAP